VSGLQSAEGVVVRGLGGGRKEKKIGRSTPAILITENSTALQYWSKM